MRYGPAGARAAAQVRRQVPGATLYKDARQDSIVDLVLGEQFRRLSTPAELARGPAGPARRGRDAARGAGRVGEEAGHEAGHEAGPAGATPSPAPSC